MREVQHVKCCVHQSRHLAEKVGKYLGSDGGKREITLSSGKLYYQSGTGHPLSLEPLSSDVFVLVSQPDQQDVQIEFQHDAQNKITGLTAQSCGEVRLTATKLNADKSASPN